MDNLAKWCAMSSALHLLLLGAIALSAAGEKRTKPVFVDLSLELSPPSAAPTAPGSKLSAVKYVSHRIPAARKPDRTAVGSNPSPPLLSALQAYKPDGGPVSRQPASVGEVASATTQTASAQSGGETTVGTPQASPGEGSPTPEKARNRYLREHFAYIREAIMKHLIYPSLARRMNWSGRVTLAFVVGEDGGVSDIRVVESSGYPLLDRSAVDTVRKAAPFPKPPARAEIVVPVSYRLL